jgi:hypothetical protein
LESESLASEDALVPEDPLALDVEELAEPDPAVTLLIVLGAMPATPPTVSVAPELVIWTLLTTPVMSSPVVWSV